jgi:hypothetical protein
VRGSAIFWGQWRIKVWGLHLMHALGQGFRRRLQRVVSEEEGGGG